MRYPLAVPLFRAGETLESAIAQFIAIAFVSTSRRARQTRSRSRGRRLRLQVLAGVLVQVDREQPAQDVGLRLATDDITCYIIPVCEKQHSCCAVLLLS